MATTVHPVEVNYVQNAHTLDVAFSDGTSASYPTTYLRGFCPCARCQGHSAGPPQWVPLTHEAQRRVEDVTQVGAYAFCIAWGDGHDTGIYTFESLHEMAVEVNAGLHKMYTTLSKP